MRRALGMSSESFDGWCLFTFLGGFESDTHLVSRCFVVWNF